MNKMYIVVISQERPEPDDEYEFGSLHDALRAAYNFYKFGDTVVEIYEYQENKSVLLQPMLKEIFTLLDSEENDAPETA